MTDLNMLVEQQTVPLARSGVKTFTKNLTDTWKTWRPIVAVSDWLICLNIVLKARNSKILLRKSHLLYYWFRLSILMQLFHPSSKVRVCHVNSITAVWNLVYECFEWSLSICTMTNVKHWFTRIVALSHHVCTYGQIIVMQLTRRSWNIKIRCIEPSIAAFPEWFACLCLINSLLFLIE